MVYDYDDDADKETFGRSGFCKEDVMVEVKEL